MDPLHVTVRVAVAAVILFTIMQSSVALSDTKRLSQLTSLKQAGSGGLVSLDISTFRSLVEASPRSYHIFAMLSADPSLCKPCAAVRSQLDKLAKDYYKLPAQKQSSKPVFFAEVKVSGTDQQFLASYGIRHVPVFYCFRAGSSSQFPKELADKSPDNYPIQEAGIGPNQLKEFVNLKSGSRMAIVRGGYQIPFVQTVRAFMPVIAAITGFCIILAIASGAYKSPMLWFGLVVLVYIFSVGGGHYSWIHNTPLAVVNNEGVWEYMASGSRSQYVAEGFFVSATCVSISVLVILIQELPSVIPNKAGQTLLGTSMVLMTIIAITALLVMYHFKMPQYLRYSEM